MTTMEIIDFMESVPWTDAIDGVNEIYVTHRTNGIKVLMEGQSYNWWKQWNEHNGIDVMELVVL